MQNDKSVTVFHNRVCCVIILYSRLLQGYEGDTYDIIFYIIYYLFFVYIKKYLLLKKICIKNKLLINYN